MSVRQMCDPATAERADSISSDSFREVLGHFTTGIAVITGRVGEQTSGLAVGSFCSLSLDPPLVLFCPAKTSASWPLIQAAGSFCVNILAEDQQDLCALFAGKSRDKFANVAWHPASTGSPILDGVLAWIDCRVNAVQDSGDHYVVIGDVLDLSVERSARPLISFRGGFELGS